MLNMPSRLLVVVRHRHIIKTVKTKEKNKAREDDVVDDVRQHDSPKHLLLRWLLTYYLAIGFVLKNWE